MFGVSMAEPKQPSWAKPRSSKRMTMTFGAPAGGCGSSGCLALLSAGVRPSWGRVSISGRVGLRSVAALGEPGHDRGDEETDGQADHRCRRGVDEPGQPAAGPAGVVDQPREVVDDGVGGIPPRTRGADEEDVRAEHSRKARKRKK